MLGTNEAWTLSKFSILFVSWKLLCPLRTCRFHISTSALTRHLSPMRCFSANPLQNPSRRFLLEICGQEPFPVTSTDWIKVIALTSSAQRPFAARRWPRRWSVDGQASVVVHVTGESYAPLLSICSPIYLVQLVGAERTESIWSRVVQAPSIQSCFPLSLVLSFADAWDAGTRRCGHVSSSLFSALSPKRFWTVYWWPCHPPWIL